MLTKRACTLPTVNCCARRLSWCGVFVSSTSLLPQLSPITTACHIHARPRWSLVVEKFPRQMRFELCDRPTSSLQVCHWTQRVKNANRWNSMTADTGVPAVVISGEVSERLKEEPLSPNEQLIGLMTILDARCERFSNLGSRVRYEKYFHTESSFGYQLWVILLLLQQCQWQTSQVLSYLEGTKEALWTASNEFNFKTVSLLVLGFEWHTVTKQ